MAAVDATTERVEQLLKDWLGSAEEVDGGFNVADGPFLVRISFSEIGEDHVSVDIRSPVAYDVPIDSELFMWVALQTDAYTFGHVGCHDNGDGTALVSVRHSLLGDTVDPDELRLAVTAVAMTAAELVLTVTSVFGGDEPET